MGTQGNIGEHISKFSKDMDFLDLHKDVTVFQLRCGFARSAFVMNFMGCLSGADADLLDAHEEGLMKMFCDEYARSFAHDWGCEEQHVV